jgi:hypothetical protein
MSLNANWKNDRDEKSALSPPFFLSFHHSLIPSYSLFEVECTVVHTTATIDPSYPRLYTIWLSIVPWIHTMPPPPHRLLGGGGAGGRVDREPLASVLVPRPHGIRLSTDRKFGRITQKRPGKKWVNGKFSGWISTAFLQKWPKWRRSFLCSVFFPFN